MCNFIYQHIHVFNVLIVLTFCSAISHRWNLYLLPMPGEGSLTSLGREATLVQGFISVVLVLQGNINEKDIERNFEGCEVFFTQRISRTFPREAPRWHNHLLFIILWLISERILIRCPTFSSWTQRSKTPTTSLGSGFHHHRHSKTIRVMIRVIGVITIMFSNTEPQRSSSMPSTTIIIKFDKTIIIVQSTLTNIMITRALVDFLPATVLPALVLPARLHLPSGCHKHLS